MPIRRRLGTSLTALTALALLAVGCSDDPEPKFADDTPTPTSTPTTSDPTESTSTDPTETETSVDPSVEPEYPEEAEGGGKASAVEFASYFMELVDYADTSQDTATLKRISPFCSACRNLVSLIKDLKSEWTSTVGIRRTVTDVTVEMTTLKGRENAVMQVSYDTNRYKIIDKDGEVTWKKPSSLDAVLIISRSPDDKRWRVDDLGPAS